MARPVSRTGPGGPFPFPFHLGSLLAAPWVQGPKEFERARIAPLEVQEQLKGGKVKGVYHWGRHGTPREGTVYLLADRVGDLAVAFERLAHEIVGHAGVMGVLGRRGWQRTVGEDLASRDGRRLVSEWESARGHE